MRPIDADALNRRCIEGDGDDKFTEGYNFAINEIKSYIAEAPTIEGKTGRWVLVDMGDTDLYECSLCRKRKTYMPPFCDMCGARMEGAEE